MSQSNNRRRRRATRAVSKKVASRIAKDNGVDVSSEVSLDPRVQGAKIVALEQAIQQLVKIQNENQQALFRAFNLTDAHLWVLKQVCQDIVNGCVITRSEGLHDAVDMGAYYNRFNAFLAMKAEEAAKEKVKREAGILDPSESTEGHEVFGGDLNHADPEGNEIPEEKRAGDGENGSNTGTETNTVSEVPDASGPDAGSRGEAGLQL